MNLTEFMTARIAEDEDVARQGGGGLDLFVGTLGDDEWLYVGAARVLAECEAKRRILALHQPNDLYKDGRHVICEECGDLDASPAPHPCCTLRWLAFPYADHADYRDEWKP